MASPKNDFKIKTLHWIIFLVPFAVLAVWIAQFAQKSLNWDDWGLVSSRFPTDDLKPNFAGMFSSSQGHLIPILHFSVIPAILLADGDPRFLVVACVLLALLSGRLIVRMAKDSSIGAGSNPRSLPVGETLIISLAVACPLYGNTWMWWICWPIFMPFTCLLISISMLTDHRTTFNWSKLLAVIFLSVIAALSHGSGALVWLAVLPSLAASLGGSPKRVKWKALAIHVAAGMVILWPFLMPIIAADTGVAKPSVGIAKMVSYALTLGGGNLGQGIDTNPLVFSQILGALLCLGSVAIIIFSLHPRTDPRMRLRLLPWISVMLFGLFSIASITAGRSVLPDQQALGGRYLLLTYPLWLGLYFAGRIVLKEGAAGHAHATRSSHLLVITVFLVALQVNAWFEGYRSIRWHHASLQTRAAPVNFQRIFPRNPGLLRSHPHPDSLIQVSERLERHDKLAGFRLYPTDDLSVLGSYKSLKPQSGGQFVRASTDQAGRILLEGYAYLEGADRPSDLIILSWETDPNSPQRMFCLVPMFVRDDFYHSFERHRRPENFTQWQIRLKPDQFPRGTIIVRAWAFDHEKGKRYRLFNSVTLEDGTIKTFQMEAPGREEVTLEKMWPVKVDA